MFVTATLLGLAFAALAYVAWWLQRSGKLTGAQSLGAAAAATWLVAISVVAWQRDEPAGRSSLVRSLDSLAWPQSSSLPEPAPVAATASGVQAGSVESLIGRLEARLAAQPNDANGWALLAQSYAYTADEEAVERAVRRAIELGFDEQSLRERIASTQRNVQPTDWGEHAIRARR